MNKKFWKFLAWISIACGVIAYTIGWYTLIKGTIVWNIPTQFYFYDAIAAGIFALYFLIYSIHYGKK